MAIVGQYVGVFKGSDSGTSAKGKDWVSAKFILAENVNGAEIPPTAMTKPNASIFLPDGDYSDLKEGHQYLLKLTVSIRKDSTYPNYNLVQIQPKV